MLARMSSFRPLRRFASPRAINFWFARRVSLLRLCSVVSSLIMISCSREASPTSPSDILALSSAAEPLLGTSVALIAYDRLGPARYDVLLYDLTASANVPLPGLNDPDPDADDRAPSISDDGNLIAFESDRDGPDLDIFLYRRSTASLVALPGLNTNDYEMNPALSGDGRLIAFTRFDSQVYVYDRRTASVIPLGLDPSDFYGQAAISRDGNFVAFTNFNTGVRDVQMFRRSTGTFLPLPGINKERRTEENPALAARGQFIAFSNSSDILLFDRSTSPASQIVLPGLNTTSNENYPALSRDARYISFFSGSSGSGDVLLYDRSTSSLVPTPGLNDPAALDLQSSLTIR